MAEDDGGVTKAVVRSVVRTVFGGAEKIAMLISFASSPIQFLRKRITPLILGGIFGFVFDLAAIIRRPFLAISASLDATGGSLENAVSVTFSPIQWFTGTILGFLVDVSAAFGWFQPFVLAALSLLVLYVIVILGLRLLRAILDAVPGLSGVETFIFG